MFLSCLDGKVICSALHICKGDHPNLQKNVYICLQKKILYVKLTYLNHPNKNFEHPDLKSITI